jgi:sulfur-oxidizing protein SoxY
MPIGRRLFLHGTVAFAGWLAFPRAVLAAVWPAKAFSETAASQAMTELFGTDRTTPSTAVSLSAPEVAENGAVVPVSVKATLENVSSVSIVVEKNPRPLAISFDIPPGTLPDVACRIKMAQTSQVMAVVQTDSGLYSASREVKVTIGGCGG